MKHALFAAVMLFLIVVWGQNWTTYSAALMTAAWVRHGGRLDDPIW